MARDIDLGPTPAGKVGAVLRRARPEKMAIKRNPPEVRVDLRAVDMHDWWVAVRAQTSSRTRGHDRLIWCVGIAREGLFLSCRHRRDPNRAVGAAILLAMMLGRSCLYVMPGEGRCCYRTKGEYHDMALEMEERSGENTLEWRSMDSMDDFVSVEACPMDGAVRLVLAEDMRLYQVGVMQVEDTLRDLLGVDPEGEV